LLAQMNRNIVSGSENHDELMKTSAKNEFYQFQRYYVIFQLELASIYHKERMSSELLGCLQLATETALQMNDIRFSVNLCKSSE